MFLKKLFGGINMKKMRTSSLPISPEMEILQDRFPRQHIFVTNQPAGFGIADRGAKRGSGLVYLLSSKMPVWQLEQILAGLEIFFNGGIDEEADYILISGKSFRIFPNDGIDDRAQMVADTMETIVAATGLNAVTENYLGYSVVFGRYRVGRRTNIFELTMPAEATHIAINATWLPDYAPRTPVTEKGIFNMPYWRRTSDAIEPTDFYVWQIGGVYHDCPSRIVSDLSAAAVMRNRGKELYRYFVD